MTRRIPRGAPLCFALGTNAAQWGTYPIPMRLLLTATFLVAAAVHAADLAVPVPGKPAPVVADRVLPLSEAIDRALVANLGLAVTRIEASRSLDSVDVSQAGFDTILSWRNEFSGSRVPYTTPGLHPIDRAFESDVTVSRKFTWGGTLAVGGGTTRSWDVLGGVRSPNDYSFGTHVSYSQPLLAGGWQAVNLTSLISAREAALRSRLALRAAALDLIRDTEVAYWTLAGTRTLVVLRETSLRSAESLLAQVKAKRQLGDATVLEELQAEADVSSQKVAVLNARQSLDNAEMRLRRLLGRGTAEDVEQPLAVLPIPSAPVGAPAEFRPWIRTVAGFDFDSAIQLSAITQAEAVVEQARQNDHPSLNLVVSSSSYSDGVPGFSSAYDSFRRNAGWTNSAGLTLSFPLGFRESEATLRSAVRARRQAELRLADVRQTLVFNARATWRDLEAARARVEATASALELQRQSYEGERARYDAGQSDILRVLQARAALDSAQVDWVQAQLDARAASARVARLDGSILPRHGFSMSAIESRVGGDAGLDDTLPPLPDTP